MVTTGVYHITYTGDGATTAFPFTFPFDSSDDIVVVIVDEDGTETTLESDYYINTVNNTVYYPGYAPGSEPPLADQPAVLTSDQQIVIYRSTPITQESDLGEKWPFATIEDGLDKLTMILQETSYEVGCALRVSDATAETAGDDLDLEIPIEAGKTLVGNGTSTGYETATALLLDEDNGVWDANSIPVSNLPTPTNSTDATNKAYVDGLMSDEVLRNIDATYEDADLDAFTTCGVYFVRRSSTAVNTSSWTDDLSTVSNGFLTVLTTTDASRVKQIFRRWGTLNNNDFMVYQRSYQGGVWGRWTRIDGNNENVKFYFNPQGVTTTDGYSDDLSDEDKATIKANTKQGECNIIIAYGKVIMIDTSVANKATWIQNWLLNTLGITKIDYLIISHYHGDHVNGLLNMTYLDWSECTAYLPTMIPSSTYIPDDASGTITNLNTLMNNTTTFLNNQGATIVYPDEGDTLTINPNFKITFYNCNQNANILTYATAMKSSNANYKIKYNDYSMVAKVQHNDVTVVYSGDIMAAAQKRMYDRKFYQNVNVYKHHHHGYNYTGYVPYANAVNPDIVVNQNHIDFINDTYVNTDLRYFIEKKLLIPMTYQVLLESDGKTVDITQGKETYPWKNRHVFDLAPNTDRIPSGSNLNDYLLGTYSFATQTVLTSCTNAPSDWTYGNARLVCIYNRHTGYEEEPSGDKEDQDTVAAYVTQMLISAKDPGIVYMRTMAESVWGSWVRLVNSSDTATILSGSASNVSVTAGNTKNVCSVGVTAGTWLITGHVQLSDTVADKRYQMNVYKTNSSMAIGDDGCVSNFATSNGNYLGMQTSRILSYSSSGTAYLNVYGAEACTVTAADIKAVRIV